MNNRSEARSVHKKRPSLANVEAAEELTPVAFARELHTIPHTHRHITHTHLKNDEFSRYQEETEDKRFKSPKSKQEYLNFDFI